MRIKKTVLLLLAMYVHKHGIVSSLYMFSSTKHKEKYDTAGSNFLCLYTVEPRSIVLATIVFPHVLFAIFGPELSSI